MKDAPLETDDTANRMKTMGMEERGRGRGGEGRGRGGRGKREEMKASVKMGNLRLAGKKGRDAGCCRGKDIRTSWPTHYYDWRLIPAYLARLQPACQPA